MWKTAGKWGGDYVVFSSTIEYWIEGKTVSDLFISLTRNVYEHGEPKPEGRERKLFTQLLKTKGKRRIPVLLIEIYYWLCVIISTKILEG